MNFNLLREKPAKEPLTQPQLSQPIPPVTTVTERPSLNAKRYPRPLKEGQFVYKHGKRHHSYDNEKAPYPLSYDRNVLEIEALDNKFNYFLKNSASFVNFRQPPGRVLDLGCGTGNWIFEAAKGWPDCTFVGFDLVNVQVPTILLDSSVRCRIEWRHGNFLTTRLPFDDDEFDHVHIQYIARGVPENKWGVLLDEVNRVLSPGGSVEIIEEDVVFPVLPKWFTAALRSRVRRESTVHLPEGTSRPLPVTPSRNIPPHDHALLESLVQAVYEERFINTRPTAVLPGYFTSYFRQSIIGPVIQFPMPPLAPLQPPPVQLPETSVVRNLDVELPPAPEFPQPGPIHRPISVSFSSTLRPSPISTLGSSGYSPLLAARRRPASVSFSSIQTSSTRMDPILRTNSTTSNQRLVDPMTSFKRFIIDGLAMREGEKMGQPSSLVPLDQLKRLDDRSLAMHLYRSYQSVLACQEAMWDELKYRLHHRKEELIRYGWDDDEELEELQTRKKFEKLIERFQSDIHARLSLWSSLTECGFEVPPREPLSKAEYIEELRRRECLVEACKLATAEELQEPCRTLRVLVGYK
ncbi:hypothetical protein AMATHDRAFT_62438 [Amanita thiersii Skay4041]|uniref:Methyltransferase domain-containing protein n=1 Tax=Amanita thiersii Skay4041 TaxID=703135 RepID=A0A2A9NPX5_9AGAR|nr:hypothetical protein AMATHDRAFT_62438 [Amanita thiersii Skay4041]